LDGHACLSGGAAAAIGSAAAAAAASSNGVGSLGSLHTGALDSVGLGGSDIPSLDSALNDGLRARLRRHGHEYAAGMHGDARARHDLLESARDAHDDDDDGAGAADYPGQDDYGRDDYAGDDYAADDYGRDDYAHDDEYAHADDPYDDADYDASYTALSHHTHPPHHHQHHPHQHHPIGDESPHMGGALGGALGGLGEPLPGAPEMHSDLIEAVMQQWLQTPAGQSAAQEAARLGLSTDEVGQFFHARMLQSLGRLRLGAEPQPSLESVRTAVGSLPEDDEAAVSRLSALGFAHEAAAEAYLACDRNEMLAANFLMDHA